MLCIGTLETLAHDVAFLTKLFPQSQVYKQLKTSSFCAKITIFIGCVCCQPLKKKFDVSWCTL
eukprot:m.174800 g.174800  ORF g.174800 m.174800 type:complete len:63 (-) comp15411_c0_seq3:113-301(-)